MTLETQPMRGRSGQARYRVNPRNRREVQVQPQAGARWEPYLLAASDEEATQAVLKLAWGEVQR